MGQQEIIDLLKKINPYWMDSVSIAKNNNIAIGSVLSSLRKLLRDGDIEMDICKIISNQTRKYFYRIKQQI